MAEEARPCVVELSRLTSFVRSVGARDGGLSPESVWATGDSLASEDDFVSEHSEAEEPQESPVG